MLIRNVIIAILLILRRRPWPTFFPFTTLFRSSGGHPVRRPGHPAARGDRVPPQADGRDRRQADPDRKSTRLNSSHLVISYAVFRLKKKKKNLVSKEMTTTIFNRLMITYHKKQH